MYYTLTLTWIQQAGAHTHMHTHEGVCVWKQWQRQVRHSRMDEHRCR